MCYCPDCEVNSGVLLLDHAVCLLCSKQLPGSYVEPVYTDLSDQDLLDLHETSHYDYREVEDDDGRIFTRYQAMDLKAIALRQIDGCRNELVARGLSTDLPF